MKNGRINCKEQFLNAGKKAKLFKWSEFWQEKITSFENEFVKKYFKYLCDFSV